jgi:hypothetical protein
MGPLPNTPPAQDYRAALAAALAPSDSAAPAVRLGESLRALNAAAVGSTAPNALLEEVAAEVERLTALLAVHARDSRFEQAATISGEGTFLNHPMIGAANPCAPRIAMHLEGERLRGDVTFGTPQEGPPGCAYGGYLAAGFDAILLMTAGIHGMAGPTKSLTVRYRRPTPLHLPLRYLGDIEAVRARDVRVEGTLVDEHGSVYAEGAAEVAQRAPKRAGE